MSTDVPRPDNSATPPANQSLPDDPVILKRMILELLETLRTTRRQNDQLHHRLDQLLRRLYGPRAEKFDPNQPFLFPELQTSATTTPPAVQAAVSEETADTTTANSPKKNGHGRRRLPESLPRIRQSHTLTEAECTCPDCGSRRLKIAEEISEQLDYQPAALFVIQHVRDTFACPKCQGQVVTAPVPAQPIAKGLPGPGLLAQIITSKYGDYLPLYRLERIFGRHGLELPRSTTCDWMAACAQVLRPLYELMASLVLQSRVVHTDDTPLPVLDKTRDKTRQGRIWVYLANDHPYTVFDFTPSRARDGPQQFLAGYQGFLQADAFAGYDGIYLASQGTIHEVACNAHARRKFFDARPSAAARAHAALAWYRQLYGIEHEIRDECQRLAQERGAPLPAQDAEALAFAWRQQKAVPVLAQFHAWLQEQQRQPDVLPKSPIGIAVNYALGNWEALARYAREGFLSIDNNAAEREMKRVAIGRKNFLFAGSDKGGQTAAVLFSFTSSCHRHGIDPFAYLRDVLDRLAGGNFPSGQLATLLPGRFATAASPTAASPTASRPTPETASPAGGLSLRPRA